MQVIHYPYLGKVLSLIADRRESSAQRDERTRAEGREVGLERGRRDKERERERERGFRALRRGGCPRLRFVGNGRSITRRSSSSAPAHPASTRQGPMPQKTGVEPTLVLPVPLSPRKGQTLPFLFVPHLVAKPHRSQEQKNAR